MCYNGKEHKLRPEHSGPYQVMNRLNDIYSIQDLVSGKVIDTHVHQLRHFNYDPERTRPVDDSSGISHSCDIVRTIDIL